MFNGAYGCFCDEEYSNQNREIKSLKQKLNTIDNEILKHKIKFENMKNILTGEITKFLDRYSYYMDLLNYIQPIEIHHEIHRFIEGHLDFIKSNLMKAKMRNQMLINDLINDIYKKNLILQNLIIKIEYTEKLIEICNRYQTAKNQLGLNEYNINKNYNKIYSNDSKKRNYFKIGLNLNSFYNDSNDWLNGTESSKWIKAYHGIGRHIINDNIEMKNIIDRIKKIGLKNGKTNVHQNCNDINHPGNKVGIGVYVTPDFNIAQNYAGKITENNEPAYVIAELRVRKDSIRQCDCIEARNYWVLNGNINEIKVVN